MAVPATLITGGLGVGKTTAILDLLARRPVGERWAVVVNEAGSVGIDGARLATEGVSVREVAGGCVCCVNGPLLRVALVRVLREVRPARVVVEASGLAMPGPIVDQLREPGLGLEVSATVALVDPRRLEALDAVGWAQIDGADVVVANRADQASPEELAAFRARMAEAWPPKRMVAETSFGRLDEAWLSLPPVARDGRIVRLHLPGHADAVESYGRTWGPELVFDDADVRAAIAALVGTAGVLRVKGALRTSVGWRSVDGVAGEVTVGPTQHRADSRLEVLAEVDVAAAVAALRPR